MSNAGHRYPPDPLTVDEVLSILAKIGGGSRTAIRNSAHLIVLWRCGLRAGESCALQVSDLRLSVPSVRVLRPKGSSSGKQAREVGLDGQSVTALEQWLACRGSQAGPLFSSATGKALHSSYLRKLLPRVAMAAGVQRRAHPHSLRSAYARELYNEGVGMVEIQKNLGHSDLTTTSLYLRSIGADETVAVNLGRSF